MSEKCLITELTKCIGNFIEKEGFNDDIITQALLITTLSSLSYNKSDQEIIRNLNKFTDRLKKMTEAFCEDLCPKKS